MMNRKVLNFPVEEMSDLHVTDDPFVEYHGVRVNSSRESFFGKTSTDSMHVQVTFTDLDNNVTSVGVRLRVLGNFSCDAAYNVSDGRVKAGDTKGPTGSCITAKHDRT